LPNAARMAGASWLRIVRTGGTSRYVGSVAFVRERHRSDRKRVCQTRRVDHGRGAILLSRLDHFEFVGSAFVILGEHRFPEFDVCR